MPIYEYRCRDCGAIIEIRQNLSDPPPAACESCQGPLEKMVSQTAFQLKGSGWYVTDYARKGQGGKPAEAPAEAAKETGGDAKKTDTPPVATTSEAKPAAPEAAATTSKPA